MHLRQFIIKPYLENILHHNIDHVIVFSFMRKDSLAFSITPSFIPSIESNSPLVKFTHSVQVQWRTIFHLKNSCLFLNTHIKCYCCYYCCVVVWVIFESLPSEEWKYSRKDSEKDNNIIQKQYDSVIFTRAHLYFIILLQLILYLPQT